jgi:hypothetical protein
MLWVGLVVVLFAVTIFNAWSPFAEGRGGGNGGGSGVYVRSGGGPNHK